MKTAKAKHERLLIPLAVLAAPVLIVATAVQLVWHGVVIPNAFAADRYGIRGVDVSHYQGAIDWPTLAAEDIDFAFMKVSEGSSYQDPTLPYNLTEAQKTGLKLGGYHFFSFESEGESQAANFISAWPKAAGTLPPVIDLEFYGTFIASPKPAEEVRPQLDAMIEALQAYYGVSPILYVTEESYEMYISGHYDTLPIWIRNVITRPQLSDGRAWTFWQYTNREKLPGYQGEEPFIDMNVFYGSEQDLIRFCS